MENADRRLKIHELDQAKLEVNTQSKEVESLTDFHSDFSRLDQKAKRSES